MKKVSMVLLFALVTIVSFGQSSVKTEQYCEIMAIGKLFSNKVTVTIDFGEARSVWADSRMKDENGKPKVFNSVMDALNFMGKEGWKLVNAFPITEGNQNVYHYVLRKDFDNTELVKN